MESLSQQISDNAAPFRYDIFLSHSRVQHDFVNALRIKLSSLGYSVFFHNIHVKLPPGHTFPEALFSAADNSKLAIVAISHDFITSQWPMIELSLFVDRMCQDPDANSFKFMPLFLNLSPEDLKNATSLLKWREIWKDFETKDDRCCAQKWEEAVNLLPALNGIVRRNESGQDDVSFIEEVLTEISGILPIDR